MKSVLVQRAQTSTTLSSSNTTISNWPITNHCQKVKSMGYARTVWD